MSGLPLSAARNGFCVQHSPRLAAGALAAHPDGKGGGKPVLEVSRTLNVRV